MGESLITGHPTRLLCLDHLVFAFHQFSKRMMEHCASVKIKCTPRLAFLLSVPSKWEWLRVVLTDYISRLKKITKHRSCIYDFNLCAKENVTCERCCQHVAMSPSRRRAQNEWVVTGKWRHCRDRCWVLTRGSRSFPFGRSEPWDSPRICHRDFERHKLMSPIYAVGALYVLSPDVTWCIQSRDTHRHCSQSWPIAGSKCVDSDAAHSD